MSEKAEISGQNQIPIDKEKLKEEYKAELKAIIDAFEQKCLLSFSTNRSGEVIKKFYFPTFVSHEESQKEDKMIHQMNQAIGHAFVNHAPLMANHIHNAVLKTLQDRGTPGFMGPAYYQGSQMVFSPVGSATGTPQIDPQAQAEGKVLEVQPISTVATTQIPSVYTNSTPVATYAQGGFMSGYPASWDPTIGFGMPPEFMVPSPTGKPSTSAEANESASQCVGSTADSTSRYRTNVTTSSYTYISTFASKSKQHVGLVADTSSTVSGDDAAAQVSYRSPGEQISSC